MKQYEIQVNGKVYHVSVKELSESSDVTPTTSQETIKEAESAVASPETVAKPTSNREVAAPIPGTILSLAVKKGQSVKAGEVLCVLEAMKMENEIVAPQSGIISSIPIQVNQAVEAGDVLVVL